MMTSSSSHRVSRESLRAGHVRAQALVSDPSVDLVPDAQHRRSVQQMLRDRPDGAGDGWLFGYGSLIWNPMVRFTARRVATVPGYHRRFCVWTHLYRGT